MSDGCVHPLLDLDLVSLLLNLKLGSAMERQSEASAFLIEKHVVVAQFPEPFSRLFFTLNLQMILYKFGEAFQSQAIF